MKTLAFRSLAIAVCLAPLVAHAAVPVNDKFSTATLLNGRDVTLTKQTCAGATADVLDPYINSQKLAHSVWYRFTSPHSAAAGHVIITHATGLLRAAVFVQADPDGNAGTLNLAGQGTNLNPGTDTINFLSVQTYRYYVCIEATGLFDITLQQPGTDNDYFGDARLLSGTKGTVVGNNQFASNTNDRPATVPANSGPTNGVWYKWTPTFNGQAIVTTNFSFLSGSTPHATWLYAFSGTTLQNLVVLDQDTNSGTYQNSRVSFNATSGTTYYLWVGTYQGVPGAFNLEYFQGTTPSEFEIYAPVNQFSEDQGPVYVEIRRHYVGDVSASVTVATANGTALANSDFAPVNTLLSFPAGNGFDHDAFSQLVAIKPLIDSVQEDDENFALTLTPGGGSSAPVPTKFFMILNGYANNAAGFPMPSMTVHENDSVVYIPVQRSSGAGEADVTFTFNAQNHDSAIQNVDYYAGATNSVTVYFPPGTTSRYIGVALLDNAKAEGNRTFTLTADPILDNQKVTGSATMSVTILDDEPPAPTAGRITVVLDGNLTLPGTVDVKVIAAGTLTGKLIMNRSTYSFTGKLDATGRFSAHIGPGGALAPVITVQLLSSTNNTYQVTLGDPVTGTQNSHTVSATNFSALNPCPRAASYTFADNSGDGGGVLQLCAGAVKVDTLGNATATGKIFDGTAYIATGSVDSSGSVAVGVTLYANQGRFTLSGNLPVTPGILTAPRINLTRPGRANQAVELPGETFTSSNTALALYSPPSSGFHILSIWESSGGPGRAVLDGAGYGVTATQNIFVSASNLVINNGPAPLPDPHLKLVFVAATGTFTGTLTPPGTTTPKPIFGALLELGVNSLGRGFFLNPATPSAGGRIKLLGP